MDNVPEKDAITDKPMPDPVGTAEASTAMCGFQTGEGITAKPPSPEEVRAGKPRWWALAQLMVLFFVEMWERFSYYGMRAILVLYLRQAMSGDNPGRGWHVGEASYLYGWYTGLAYLLPLGGGLLADKFLGTHRSVLIGSIIIALGHIALAVSGLGELATSDAGMSIFITGLALIIIGTGYFKPCMSVMIGQLYSPNDPRRDGAYTIFYMGVNLGAFFAPLCCGWLGEKVGWHWGFGCAAVGMIAGLVCYVALRPVFLRGVGEPPPGRPNIVLPLFVVSLVLAGGAGYCYHVGGFNWFTQQLSAQLAALVGHLVSLGTSPAVAAAALWSVLVVVIVAAVVWFVSIQQPGEKGPTAGIFIFMLFNAFFWIAYEQAGSTLNVFAKDSTDMVVFGWEVPASWFQAYNPLLILLIAPLFAWMWTALGRRNLDPPQAVKIALGLLLLGGGYVFMVAGAKLNATGAKVSMLWLTATYTFHTLGEMCLSPTGLSFVTRAAPARFVTLLMGMWFISSFLANLGGGIIASYVDQIEAGKIELFWYRWFKLGGRADYFLMFVISSVGAGLVILALTPVMKKLLHGKG
jgi:POT family proton-dependent oligopeptide transporter